MRNTPELKNGEQCPIVLFDGVCNLCNGWVQFLVDRDPKRKLRFASQQSLAGRTLLDRNGLPVSDASPQSVLLVEDGRVYVRSSAALRVLRHLSGGWPLFAVLLFVPVVLRDAVYDFVARHRYRWFGKSEACRVKTAEMASRFLSISREP